MFQLAIQTNKTREIAFKKRSLKKVFANVLLINQSYARFLINKNEIPSIELILHLIALLNNYNYEKKINNCFKYYELIKNIKDKFKLKVYLIINEAYTTV